MRWETIADGGEEVMVANHTVEIIMVLHKDLKDNTQAVQDTIVSLFFMRNL
jgi:hypothetical protein